MSSGPVPPAHRQDGYRVRVEWGLVGAEAIGSSASVACVVDVLSFTTAVTVAAEHGVSVLPFPWRDDRAAVYAASHGAALALGRAEAAVVPGAVSLAPGSFRRPGVPSRVVRPSPNGSTICARLAEGGASVVAGCLRNATAVGTWLARSGGSVAVIAAGERWPDGSLRPGLEDWWGAGAVVVGALRAGVPASGLSPEAAAASEAFDAASTLLVDRLTDR